jgi:hypothetical protein
VRALELKLIEFFIFLSSDYLRCPQNPVLFNKRADHHHNKFHDNHDGPDFRLYAGAFQTRATVPFTNCTARPLSILNATLTTPRIAFFIPPSVPASFLVRPCVCDMIDPIKLAKSRTAVLVKRQPGRNGPYPMNLL